MKDLNTEIDEATGRPKFKFVVDQSVVYTGYEIRSRIDDMIDSSTIVIKKGATGTIDIVPMNELLIEEFGYKVEFFIGNFISIQFSIMEYDLQDWTCKIDEGVWNE